MADPTKAEILAEKEELETALIEFKSEYDEMKKRFDESPFANDANYQREIDRLRKKADTSESELKALREKYDTEQREREVIAADAQRENENRLRQFGIRLNQSEHTRFRISERPPTGQRDIYGDPSSEVVDLGIEFDHYNGGLYVPVPVIIEIGQSIGMLTKEQADELNTELATTKAKVESAGYLAKELLSGISTHVDNFYSGLDSVVVDSDSKLSESGSNAEDSGQADGSESVGESTGVSADSTDSGSTSTGSLFGSLR